MAQFDVYRNPEGRTRSAIPYLLDVQSDLLSDLATRAVVPLVLEKRFGRIGRRLNPVFEISDHKVVMSTGEIGGVPRRALGPPVASLAAQRDTIVAAIDFLIFGI
jgi:toxin CcdB